MGPSVAPSDSVVLLTRKDHGKDLVTGLADVLSSGLFADVKLVCADGSLWSHRPLLASVSPVLESLLCGCSEEAVVTLVLPQLRKAHLKLVLDYVYRGSMYVRATQMQHVIRVIEVLHLKCGVSVSKRRDSDCAWVEEAAFQDVSDKAFNDLCHLTLADRVKTEKEEQGATDENTVKRSVCATTVPVIRNDAFEPGDSVLVRPDHEDLDYEIEHRTPVPSNGKFVTFNEAKAFLVSLVYCISVSLLESEAVVEVEPNSSDDEGLDEVTSSGKRSNDLSLEERLSSSLSSTKALVETDATLGLECCIMCGKKFRHQVNLRVHLQTHLGAKVQLKSCQACDRNFRSVLEYDLHMTSHNYSRLFSPDSRCRGRWLALRCHHKIRRRYIKKSICILRSKQPKRNLAAFIRSKLPKNNKNQTRRNVVVNGERIKSGRRRFVKPSHKIDPSKVKLKIKLNLSTTKDSSRLCDLSSSPILKKAPEEKKLNVVVVLFRCGHCSKRFNIRSSYLRHCRVQHLVDTKSDDFKRDLRKQLQEAEIIRQNPRKESRLLTSRERRLGGITTIQRQAENQLDQGRGVRQQKRIITHTTTKLTPPLKKSRNSTKSDPGEISQPLGSRGGIDFDDGRKFKSEKEMTCPTCDRVFMARSIFERHLKTYRHGKYKVISPPQPFIPSPGVQPHLNPVLQPTIEVGGKELNKYECHLCSQVFLRVKDLAKHRAKMCTAWLN